MTARESDIVEVINEEHTHFGMVGKIVSYHKGRDTAVVDIYGKEVTFRRSDLKMKARTGTNKYSEIQEVLNARHVDDLTREDYDILINHALEVGEFEWATDLVNRKYKGKRVG